MIPEIVIHIGAALGITIFLCEIMRNANAASLLVVVLSFLIAGHFVFKLF